MRKFTDHHISILRCPKDASLPRHTKRLHKKIRIAVIDSGVRKDDSKIAGWRTRGKIAGCRNFSSLDFNDWNDEVNHGTMVSRLLLDVAPEAELYIAKVSNQKTIPKNKLYCIADVSKTARSFTAKPFC